ncbi:hypothetical protein Taro_006796 [Colocasia esculenta]|uniref:RING-type domain-containing protein n=1 Tax=Colocasia esculenta TaxID=4460 RepID=A0A843TTE1_COLES|nr:hypothetical protein [Colocasia esculenta]
MHPNVILQHYDIKLYGKPVAATSIRDLLGYEESSQGGRFHVAAVAMRHRVKYEWVTRPAGSTDAEIYRKCEFMAVDEEPACLPTFALHKCELLLRNLVRCRFDHPQVQAAVFDALRLFTREALRDGWNSVLVEVEVEMTTLLSYDWVRWWCPVPCALPGAGKGHPIEALEMEVYAEEEGAAADGCAICLEDFVAGAQVERLPCHHRFHGECVMQWLDKEGSCPLCRSEF